MFSSRETELVEKLFDRLGENQCLAVAESCTAGLLGAVLTSVPGSSNYFSGGIIAYENRIKRNLLGVREESLTTEGAVSEAVAAEMVEGACNRLEADVGISVTGIAGPGGGTESKPVGRVFAGFKVGSRLIVEKRDFTGTRNQNRLESVRFVLSLLPDLL